MEVGFELGVARLMIKLWARMISDSVFKIRAAA
jgi:hypothetical protein